MILQQTTRSCPKNKCKQTEQKGPKASMKIQTCLRCSGTILLSLSGHNPHGHAEPAHVITAISFQVKVKGFNVILFFFLPIRAHLLQAWVRWSLCTTTGTVGCEMMWHGTFLPTATWGGGRFKDNMDRTWKHRLPAFSTPTPRFSVGVIGKANQKRFTK